MVVQLQREQSIANKESVLGCLRAFMSATNFAGKRAFVEQYKGIDLLAQLICADPQSEVKKAVRLQKKVLFLLNDLVVNDDNIKTDDKQYVRRCLGTSEEFIRALLTDLDYSD